MVSSPSLRLNNSLLREHFLRLQTEFLNIGLVLEASKTELMHFSRHELTRRGKPLYRGDFPPLDLGIAPFTGTTPLKPTMRWRYLGYYFDPYLSYDHHVDFYVNKAYSTLRAMRMLGTSIRGLDVDQRMLVYKGAVLPVLTYGFQLYWRLGGRGCQKHLRKLSTVHYYTSRWITGTFKTTPTGAHLYMAGLPDLCVQMDKMY